MARPQNPDLGGDELSVNHGMFTCNSYDWGTPQDLFDDLHAEFAFTLDPCATPETAKCPNFFTPETDGLSQPWSDSVFMNPPYGREIGKWMAKAYAEAQGGATVVCLVPARTDTAWWHDYAMKGEIRFLRGRLKFTRRTEKGHLRHGPAPFPSAIVIFRGINR